MSALLCKPLAYTVVSANEAALAPASNGTYDTPSLTYRSNNLTTPYIILDLGTGTLSYDTVAIVGSNLRTTDTVQVRTGTTNTGIGNYAGTALAAYAGTKPEGSTTLSFYQLGAARTERYVRIDFVATSHPDTYVQAQRIVVGKGLTSYGIQTNCEVSFYDQSLIEEGNGYTTVTEYAVVPVLKATFNWVTDAVWRSDFFGFLRTVGNNKAILVVPDTSATTTFQTDAIFGRIQNRASGKHPVSDMWTMELEIRALAP